MPMGMDKPTIGVIIVTCGEPQFEACWHSVNAQSLGPDRIDIVRDVHPMSAAFNEVLRLLSCDYSVKVDADMVLDPHALETLYNDINSSEDNVFGIGYRLRDPYYGAIGHIKIYKSGLLRSRRVSNELGYDRVLVKELNKEGYLMVYRAETLGVHLPNPTPEELFKRALGTARRFLKFKDTRDTNEVIKHMARRWCVGDDETAFAGLIGYCGGLLLEHEDEEKHFRTFGAKEWSSIKWMFKRSATAPIGQLEGVVERTTATRKSFHAELERMTVERNRLKDKLKRMTASRNAYRAKLGGITASPLRAVIKHYGLKARDAVRRSMPQARKEEEPRPRASR
jgi:hypothetical protein